MRAKAEVDLDSLASIYTFVLVVTRRAAVRSFNSS
ncbi:hypothetical protein ALP61_03356 [Pseudomonas savastanoi]|nr:hypothetical protein ALP61_03356 [Pseudomonas savastanoi]